MNLVMRMIMIILGARLSLKQSVLCSRKDNFRVWLHDLGWRDHLPNYRVFSFMELGRFGLWHQSRLALSGGYGLRMIAAQDFIYLKPILPLQSFSMTTEVLGWDEKYFYYLHKFYCADNLVGIGLVKEICLKSGKPVAPALLLKSDQQKNLTMVADIAPVQHHAVVEKWLQTQQQIKASH